MLKQIFSGITQRIVAENAMQLHKTRTIRPKQIAKEIALFNTSLNTELSASPELKKEYDSALADLVKAITTDTPSA